MSSLVALDTLAVEHNHSFSFATWSWHDTFTSTRLVSLIWVNCSRCTCSPNLVVIGLVETEKSILTSILKWIPWKRAELTSLVCHIGKCSESGILIYNSTVLDVAAKKMRSKGRTQATAKRNYKFSRKRNKLKNLKNNFIIEFHIFQVPNFSLNKLIFRIKLLRKR